MFESRGSVWSDLLRPMQNRQREDSAGLKLKKSHQSIDFGNISTAETRSDPFGLDWSSFELKSTQSKLFVV
jgi:hypothetical protein